MVEVLIFFQVSCDVLQAKIFGYIVLILLTFTLSFSLQIINFAPPFVFVLQNILKVSHLSIMVFISGFVVASDFTQAHRKINSLKKPTTKLLYINNLKKQQHSTENLPCCFQKHFDILSII